MWGGSLLPIRQVLTNLWLALFWWVGFLPTTHTAHFRPLSTFATVQALKRWKTMEKRWKTAGKNAGKMLEKTLQNLEKPESALVPTPALGTFLHCSALLSLVHFNILPFFVTHSSTAPCQACSDHCFLLRALILQYSALKHCLLLNWTFLRCALQLWSSQGRWRRCAELARPRDRSLQGQPFLPASKIIPNNCSQSRFYSKLFWQDSSRIILRSCAKLQGQTQPFLPRAKKQSWKI